jgi:hypothetical protein
MSRDLSDELAETLRERADSVPDVATLADASLARGRALRRRRRIGAAVAPAVAAVVVVTAATALTGGGDRADGPPPPAGTPTATRGLPAPPPPYAYKLGEDPGPGTFHVVTGSASVRLPDAVSVLRIFRAGGDVVAEVLGTDRQSVVLVGAHGDLRTLPDLLPPVAVSRDGAVLAAQTQEGGTLGLALLELPDGKQVAALPGENRVPLAVVRGTDPPVVLFSAGDRLGTWNVSEQSAREIPGVRYDEGAVLAAAPDGRRVIIADERELRVVDLEGRTLWRRSGEYWIEDVFAWSPDGTRVVLSENQRIVVVAAADGRELVRSRQQAFDLVRLRWTDAGRLVGVEREPVTERVTRQQRSCDVVTGACEPYRRRLVLLPEP